MRIYTPPIVPIGTDAIHRTTKLSGYGKLAHIFLAHFYRPQPVVRSPDTKLQGPMISQ